MLEKSGDNNGIKIDMWNPNNNVADDGEKALWEALKSAGILKKKNGENTYLFNGQSYNKFQLEFEKIEEKSKFTHNIYIYKKGSKEPEWLVRYIANYQPYGDSKYTYQLLVAEWEEYNSYQVMKGSTASQLKGVVSTWYYYLRNFALLVLMLVLIYSGIRIVIGSTAGQKAKYKERLLDWLVAVCLVFIMHYIMAFAINLNEKIIELVDEAVDVGGSIQQIELSQNQYDSVTGDDAPVDLREFGDIVESGGKKYLNWRTDLMGRMRIISQEVNEGTARWVAYSLCYIILVLQTLFFSWTYLRRVVYMAFLTMIAPLVAMTYPIDKITDGKAQAFSMWLKEYIFNLLIQPVHLIIYTVLVSSAYTLASTNPLYAIVAIGFLMPAEKLLRKFFGFEKAQTPGLLGGAGGAALGMLGLQKLMGLGKKAKSRSHKSEKSSADKIRFSKGNKHDEKAAIAKEKGANKGSSGTEAKKGKPADTPNEATTPKVRTKEQPKVEPKKASQETPKVETSKTGEETKPKNKTKDKTNNKGKPVGALKAATLAYGRSLKGKAIKNIKKKGPKALIKGAAGISSGLFGATAFGMAGLALGVASGDPNKALQYTTAGAMGGYGAGKGISDATVEGLSVNGKKFKDDVQLAWYGDEYKSKMLEKEKKEMMKDEDNIQYMRKVLNLPRDEAKQLLEETGGACFDAGITDMADIAAIHKMTKEGIGLEQAIAAQQWNEHLPSSLKQIDFKDRNDYISKWAQEFENDGYENGEELAMRAMELTEKFNKAKSSLTDA